MSYKRKDLLFEDGHILTPDFEFWVECTQDADDPVLAVVSRHSTNISPKIIDDDGFNKVFDRCFEDLTLSLKRL